MDPNASAPLKPLSTYTPQSDSSKYIRTYAKDFAALSGQAADMGAPPPAPKPIEPEKTTVTESGVTLSDYDPSPVNHSEAASPKEFDQEVVDLKQSDSDGIFSRVFGKTPAAAQPSTVSESPLMPQSIIAPLPKVSVPAPAEFPEPIMPSAPVSVPQSPSVPPAPPIPEPVPATPTPAPEPAPMETDTDREAILARLRAKVAAERAVNTTAPAASEIPLRTGAPDFASTPEPVLPIPQVRREPEPVAAPVPLPEASSPLHTYSSDFADRIDTANGSTFSVLAAQSDAGQTPRSTEPRKRNLTPLLAGGAMLLIGIGAILGAYFFTRQGIIPMTASVPSLITFDESVEVKGAGHDLMQAVANVGQGGSVQGNVIVTYVTLATTTGAGIPQPGGVLIKDMSLSAPDILLRNTAETSTVGIIRAGTESRPFMILKVNSYERTFAGMLAWEPSMAADLGTFYPPYPAQSADASSTPIAATISPSFIDAVVANYDVRILRDSNGKSIMLYGYLGKDTLIIARDEAAFTALVSRLNASGN